MEGDLDTSLAALDDRLAQIQRELATVTGRAPPPGQPPGAEPAAEAVEPAASGGSGGERLVLDAGPFADIASLLEFEIALRQLPEVREARVHEYVRRRALVDVRLAPARALLDSMRRALPYRFAVVREADDALTLAVDARRGEQP